MSASLITFSSITGVENANPLLDFFWNHKKWPHYTKEFIKYMSMYK